MRNVLIRTLVLSLLFGVAPAQAGMCFVNASGNVKQNSDSPIQIQGYEATRTSNTLSIAFINASKKTASSVLFEVRAGDGHAYVRDAGDFAPSVLVKHCVMPYGLHQGNYEWLEQARVRVVRVVFADGTKWEIQDAPKDESDF